MADVKTFNPKRIALSINGIEVDGFPDATFIEIERISDLVASKAGARGEVVRVINNDPRHEIRLTLMQSSAMHKILKGLEKLDRETCGGAMMVFYMSDLCGTDMFVAPQTWVAKSAPRSYGVEVADWTWTLHCGEPAVDLM